MQCEAKTGEILCNGIWFSSMSVPYCWYATKITYASPTRTSHHHMSIPINLFLVLWIWKLNFPPLSRCSSSTTSCNATVTALSICTSSLFLNLGFPFHGPRVQFFPPEVYLFWSYVIHLLSLLDLFLLLWGFGFLYLLHFLFSSLAEEKGRQLYFSVHPWHQHWALSYFFTRFTYFLSLLYQLPSIQKHMQHQTKSKHQHHWLPTL